MCNVLEGQESKPGEKLTFDKSGKNTLYPLTEGFNALLKVCESYLSGDLEIHKRNKAEMPSFWQKTDLINFPFESRIHLLNIKYSEYTNIASIISEFYKEFVQNNVISVRNKLNHNRDIFPSKDEILNTCKTIESAFRKLEDNSIYPNVFLFNETLIDKFKRVKHYYRDYKGNTISLQPTFEFMGSKLPSSRIPQIIIPAISIGSSHEFLRFEFQEDSSYLKFWSDFPRKKHYVNKPKSNKINAPHIVKS